MESFVADLKHQVQCSLCKETMTDPKLAYCFHTFCKMCIKTNTQVNEKGNNVFECPECVDSETFLQDLNDVEDLQDSPLKARILDVLKCLENEKICSISNNHPQASYQCLNCNESLCNECLPCHSKYNKNHQVVLFSDLQKEDIEKMLKRESACETHDDKDVEFYCQACNMLICLLCLRDLHHNHKTKHLQEFVANKKDSMSKNLEQIAKLSTKDENEKKQQERLALLMQRYSKRAKLEIENFTEKITQALENDKQQLLNQVEKNKTRADNNLRIIRHMTQAQEFMSKLVQVGTAKDFISCQEIGISQTFMYDPYPQDTTGVVFEHNETLCKHMESGLGLVRPFKKADPKMSSIEIDSSNIEVSKKSKLTVNLKTSEGDITDETLENLSIQFTPEDNVEVEEMQLEGDGVITVDFTPRVCCQLTVDVQVYGNTLSNSPIVVLTKPQQIRQMRNDTKLRNAFKTESKDLTGIAVNAMNSKIAVADQGLHCVKVFNMEGDLLLEYDGQERAQKLNKPQGLAFLNERDLVIADSENHRICIVNTSTGQLVRTFGCHGDGNGQFESPYGVHVDEDLNIIVCDYYKNRVQVFTKEGDYLYQLRVQRPHSAITHNGLFYVSDQKNSMVHAIKMKDKQSLTKEAYIDDKNYMDCQLQCPCGLAVNNDNNLLISDHYADFIYEFTSNGHYVGQSSHLTSSARYIVVLNNGQVICTTKCGVVFFSNANNS